jgi:hypothetical protein
LGSGSFADLAGGADRSDELPPNQPMRARGILPRARKAAEGSDLIIGPRPRRSMAAYHLHRQYYRVDQDVIWDAIANHLDQFDSAAARLLADVDVV